MYCLDCVSILIACVIAGGHRTRALHRARSPFQRSRGRPPTVCPTSSRVATGCVSPARTRATATQTVQTAQTNRTVSCVRLHSTPRPPAIATTFEKKSYFLVKTHLREQHLARDEVLSFTLLSTLKLLLTKFHPINNISRRYYLMVIFSANMAKKKRKL